MTNERHEKALEAACRAMHELQGTGDADAPLFSPYQNSWDEPDTVRWTQWKESCEEVIKAYLDSMDAVILPKEPPPARTVSACFSYRHDFGLLPPLDREALGRTANNWLEAWIKAVPNYFTNGE